jgi:thioredoxin reductase
MGSSSFRSNVANVLVIGAGAAGLRAAIAAHLERIAELRQLAGEMDVRPSSEGYADLAHALDLRTFLAAVEATS